MNENESRDERERPVDEEPFMCPICDGGTTYEWRTHTFAFGTDEDVTEISASLPMFCCNKCDMQYSTSCGERLKHEAICHHLGLLSPLEIRALRLDNGFSREKFAELTGLGVASLARWETGVGFQNQANDRYLRLLKTPYGMSRLQKLLDDLLRQKGASESSVDTSHGYRFRVIVPNHELQQDQLGFKLLREAA